MKATSAAKVKKFIDIPNIGPAVAKRLLLIGLQSPRQLKNKDPFDLYQKSCKLSKMREDPCLLDTYMAAMDFMNGASRRPWWFYTKERKQHYPKI